MASEAQISSQTLHEMVKVKHEFYAPHGKVLHMKSERTAWGPAKVSAQFEVLMDLTFE